MAIIKQYHKDTDTTYVYESISCWDSEKKQSRSKRRMLGKLDPATGEIIPAGKRGEKNGGTGAVPPNYIEISLKETIRELNLALSESRIRNALLEEENRDLKKTISRLKDHAAMCLDLCASFTEEKK